MQLVFVVPSVFVTSTMINLDDISYFQGRCDLVKSSFGTNKW